MSPLSAPVLVGAAVVASPALWAAMVEGSMTAETALVRYLVCVGLCWAAFAVLAMLVGPPPAPPRVEPPSVPKDQESETVG